MATGGRTAVLGGLTGFLICGLLSSSCSSGPSSLVGGPAAFRAGGVVAFYYPWYGTPQVSGYWRHWKSDVHDPAHLDPNTGLPDIAGVYHPYPGLYDSNDPVVLKRQLTEASAAGIDAFAVSWWGQGTFEDRAFAKLLSVAAEIHSPMRFTIYYEQVPGNDPQKAIADFRYLMSRYGTMKSFLSVGGKPVFFVYGRAIFPGEFCLFGGCTPGSPLEIDWTPVNSYLHSRYGAVVYGDEGTTLVDLTSTLKKMGFDGIHLYNPQLDIKFLSPATVYSRIEERGVQEDMKVAATVIPGYDDSALGRKYPSVVGRENGALYTRLWQAACAEKPDIYLITTFNEWHESSAIEPAFEWRNKYLDLTRQLDRCAK